MARDLLSTFANLDQRAFGTIQVTGFNSLHGVAASGQITISDYTQLALKTFTVGVNVLTEGVNFTAGTSNNATATSLASAINALAGVGAAAVGNVITITADAVGVAGNTIALLTNAVAGVTLSAATLLGGIAAGTFTIGVNTLVEGADFNAITSNNATATALAAAIEALSGYTAAAVGDTVTLFWETPGTAGNSKALATSIPGAVTLSGATLSGGVAATYTEWMDYPPEGELRELETNIILTALAGNSPTVDITPQFSYDKVGVKDYGTVFTQLTGAGNQTIEQEPDGNFVRFKIVLGGTNPIASGTLRSIVR